MHTTNVSLQSYSPDQQRFAQSVAFDSITPQQQDFLLYVPLNHEADPAKMLVTRNDWVRLTLAGQGTVYARLWGEGIPS